MAHQTRIDVRNDRTIGSAQNDYVPSCSCGWEGRHTTTIDRAMAGAMAHPGPGEEPIVDPGAKAPERFFCTQEGSYQLFYWRQQGWWQCDSCGWTHK